MGHGTRSLGGLSPLGPLLLLTWAATLAAGQGQEGSAAGPTHLNLTHLSATPELLSTVEPELRAEDRGNSTQGTTGNDTGEGNSPLCQSHLTLTCMYQKHRETMVWALLSLSVSLSVDFGRW